MKSIFKTTFLALVCLSLYAANSSAEFQPPADCNKTEVVIIGTIHNFHYESPKYTPEVLKEIILALKPDAILNELPLSLVDPNGRPLFRDPKKHPEGWAADTVAMKLGIKQIPFDRPDRQENFKKTNYFKRQERSNKLGNKWGEQIIKEDPNSVDLKIAQLLGYAGQAEGHLFMNSGPEVINSEAHDSVIRIKKSLWYDIIPTILRKYPEYETLIDDYHFASDQWQQRNRIMVDNILKAAKEYPGKRLVVITGATHRYILRDLLKQEKSIDLKEYWEVMENDPLAPEQTEDGNRPAYLKPIPPDKLKEDLDFLFKTIEEVHPNMYAYTSKEEFEPIKEKLYKQIDHPMNRIEFYKLVAPVVAALKSGHTRISGLWEDFRSYCESGGKVFPIELDWDGERAFLAGNYGPIELPIGGTLLAINGEDTGSVIFRWARYSPNEQSNSDPWLTKRRVILCEYLWLEYGDTDSLILRIKSIEGKIADYRVPAISSEQVKKAVRTQKGVWNPFCYRYISEHDTGLIELNQWNNVPAFSEFLDKTFKELYNKKIRNLIIDIRKNPGGSSVPGDWLLKYLTDKPFAQFEGYVIQPDDKPFRFGGRIFVLIGRLSASASVSFASAIKCSHIGTLIGEETGDTTVNYGEARYHKLTNSGLQAVIPTKYFVQACGQPDGRGVLPDYEVKQKPEDTAKGVDTVLEFTLNLIKSSKAKK